MSIATVLGAGSWGTAFALVLADAGAEVRLWARRPELAHAIGERHENPDYLPGVRLPDRITATADPAEALRDTEAVVLAIPSQELRANLTRWVELIPPAAVVVSLAKGIELGTGKRMSEVVEDVLGEAHGAPAEPSGRIAVVSGPNLAREVALRQPAAAVVACRDGGVAERLQKMCHSPAFRPYTNTDVIGCELGGAVKNVIALAVGIAVGLGFGDNARASVITRGLAETTRLGVAMGADPYTFAGLAGLGDLVATCSSPLSRNRGFGERLGQGQSVAEIAGSARQVAEGVRSCVPVCALAREHGVEMPIAEHVAAVVQGELTPREMVSGLLGRSAKPERHGW